MTPSLKALRGEALGLSKGDATFLRQAELIGQLIAALDHVEAVLSIVEPRSHKAEYLETLNEVRAALSAARGEGQ